MARLLVALSFALAAIAPVLGQTPQPFPRPGIQQPATPPQPAAPVQPPPAPTTTAPASQPAVPDRNAPDAATVYFPVYPTAQFLASYDAGRGQRYYIYGTTATYAELVAYYRTQLRERGDQVFAEPPTHMFSIGRFRQETMAFPPGVTIKDWTWGGSKGYPNPHPDAEQPRFPSIIMIVPPPAAPTTQGSR